MMFGQTVALIFPKFLYPFSHTILRDNFIRVPFLRKQFLI